ncbi:type I-E CRISPR-associated protein Cse1/CasA [Streptomyces thermocarboxydus]
MAGPDPDRPVPPCRAARAVQGRPDGDRRLPHLVDARATAEGADPYQILDRRRDGDFQPREADGARALWRDLDSLLLEDSRQDARRPPALEHLPQWLLPKLRVRAYGFDQDGQQGQRLVQGDQPTDPAVAGGERRGDGLPRQALPHSRRAGR